jgi:hypothetical protein
MYFPSLPHCGIIVDVLSLDIFIGREYPIIQLRFLVLL